ncbi:small ribosomal subunit protein mS27 [Tribolium castaneum]|uniref:Uncharacterized protein n=1 Tax=Tribolium castaneum TaxID=7070 RepID=D2A267_TRICA|nr:PREDICTED: 28S ribosomal protein S27, mitochondrial [Tribolium castaneum]EFA02747.1 hypothetical protein TcasGA2_TC008478 [Tribolium castaneum]|eukprot:XP_974377.1 PREDICTED: 28S ribosomal protein S27, mitochondrial [Tribolium castaneum]
MLKIIQTATRRGFLKTINSQRSYLRTFLSQAYYCNEVWDSRLNSPLLQKVNLDGLYYELDQGFQKTRRISPVDVDIFANALKDDVFIDELLDLVHKLRLSPDTGNTLNSTSHAVVRTLLRNDKVKELLQVLDDRLNYGVFLDDYTANILMDKFWKSKDFAAGCLVASQMMLQEDLKHPVTVNLALLHCYNYLLKPGDWLEMPQPEEPEEEVKIRVNYIRNPFNDEHFDLREPQKIVGKTLAAATRDRNDSLHNSLRIIGLALFGKEELVKKEMEARKNTKLIKQVVQLLPDDNPFKADLTQLELVSEDVQTILEKQLTESIAVTSEKDIANQCSLFKQWENERLQALEEQKKRLHTLERLAEVERMKKELSEKEEKLWFFENEEKIELEIEEGTAAIPTRQTKEKKTDEDYVPPEIIKTHN